LTDANARAKARTGYPLELGIVGSGIPGRAPEQSAGSPGGTDKALTKAAIGKARRRYYVCMRTNNPSCRLSSLI